jgi:predicted metalloprotease with PDZ domain
MSRRRVSIVAMNSSSVDAAVVYSVRPADPGGHILEISCRINDPDSEGQVVSLPAWVPGSYMVRDYARHVLDMKAEAGGVAVSLHKVDKSTWRASPVAVPLVLRVEIYANDLSVRGAYFDSEHGFLNGACLFLRVHGHEEQRCLVHIGLPEVPNAAGWKVATSLRRLTGTEHEFGAFEASDYEELIDQPVLMGDLSIVEFDVAGTGHQLAIAGRHDADLDRLRMDVQQVCETHARFFGSPLPMSRYCFLLTVMEQGYGGLEHGSSSALLCDRTHLPRAGESGVTPDYRKFLGLVSHEYFHLWNVKRIRPAAFVNIDLDKEAYTRQLWFFEGVTSYYDDLALLRGGLISEESYLELLGCTLTAVYRSRGRRIQSLEDSSFDAWIKFYKQDENAPNAIISYYAKGAMVALALDLEIRLRTGDQHSLDDVMHELWRQYDEDDYKGVPEGGVERIAEEVSGLSLADFFRQSLRLTVDPPVGILLAQFGVRLHLRSRESQTDRGGKPGEHEDVPRPWLGILTRAADDRVFVRNVLADGPAKIGGLAADDEMVALDGYRVTAKNIEQRLSQVVTDRPTKIHCFRHGLLQALEVTAVRAPRDTCYLGLETAADAATVTRRGRWLGPSAQ